MSDMRPGKLERDAYGRVVRNGRVLDSPVQVDGYDVHGHRQVALDLPHGVAPADALRAEGWEPIRPTGAERSIGDPHAMVLSYSIARLPDGPVPLPDDPVDVDPGVDLAAHEPPLVRTRIAAYAGVIGPKGVLLTTASARTNAVGAWGLPGGGVEPGEDPEAAVVREVWEETGQDVIRPRLADILSHHWIGLSPKGVLEDFQAIRLVYRVELHREHEVVVHDLDGTTEAAAWVPLDKLPTLTVAPAWTDLLERFLLR